MPRIIKCAKHGKVRGHFCELCRAEKYVEKVKAGKIKPQPLELFEERPLSEPSQLQIRFRAFRERTQRALSNKPYCWEQRSRNIRIIQTKHLEG